MYEAHLCCRVHKAYYIFFVLFIELQANMESIFLSMKGRVREYNHVFWTYRSQGQFRYLDLSVHSSSLCRGLVCMVIIIKLYHLSNLIQSLVTMQASRISPLLFSSLLKNIRSINYTLVKKCIKQPNNEKLSPIGHFFYM